MRSLDLLPPDLSNRAASFDRAISQQSILIVNLRRATYEQLLAVEMGKLPSVPGPEEEKARLVAAFAHLQRMPMSSILRSEVDEDAVPDAAGLFMLFRDDECVYASEVKSLRKRIWGDYEFGGSPLRSRAVTRGIAKHLGLVDSPGSREQFAELGDASIRDIRSWLSECDAAWVLDPQVESEAIDPALIHRFFRPILQPTTRAQRSRAELARERRIRAIETDCAQRIADNETRVADRRRRFVESADAIIFGLGRAVLSLLAIVVILVFFALYVGSMFTPDSTDDDLRYDQSSESDYPSQAVQDYCAGAVSAAQEEGCLSHVTDSDLP